MSIRTTDFNFDLPRGLIASRPSEKRDCSRLLVLHKDGSIEHKRFFEITDYLEEGDMMIMNNTKVFPARIIGQRAGGQAVDLLLVREDVEKGGEGAWEILCKGSVDGPVTLFDGIKAEIVTHHSENKDEKKRYLHIPGIAANRLNDLLWKYGYMPLPPYIKRMPEDADKERYQTVYAERQGSIAAPTAGLHFTDDLIIKIREKGVLVRFLTLHVGTGTFKPVRAEYLKDHRMDGEYFEINQSVINELLQAKGNGKKVLGVGTTTTRVLESISREGCLAENPGRAAVIKGLTDIFIYPGHSFGAVGSLLTNFHLPGSTPLMLVSALAGFDKILKAYTEAVAMHYRFFSYGDAMLIL